MRKIIFIFLGAMLLTTPSYTMDWKPQGGTESSLSKVTSHLFINPLSADEIIQKCDRQNPWCRLWDFQKREILRVYNSFLHHQNLETLESELHQIQSPKGKSKLKRQHVISILRIIDQSNNPSPLPFPDFVMESRDSSSPTNSNIQSSASPFSETPSEEEDVDDTGDESYERHLLGGQLLNTVEDSRNDSEVEDSYDGDFNPNSLVPKFLRF